MQSPILGTGGGFQPAMVLAQARVALQPDVTDVGVMRRSPERA